jgi:predicted transcriptional regulator
LRIRRERRNEGVMDMTLKRDKAVEKNMAQAFRMINQVIEHPDRFPDDSLVVLLDDEDIAPLFTKEKLRLLRLIKRRAYASISELAREVGRDVSRVKKDLLVLEKHGIVHMNRQRNCVTIHTLTKGIFIPLEV